MRLGDPHEEHEVELWTEPLDRGMANMTYQLITRQRYRGVGSWTWCMKREGQQVMGRGYCILSTDRRNFTNAGLQESCHGTDHNIILAMLQGEGALRNCRYIRGRTCWTIQPKAARHQTKGEVDFLELKGEVTRSPQPTKARASWISQDTWQLSERQVTLQRDIGRVHGRSG